MEYSLTPCTQVNSKWIKDLNVRPENIKLLEENIDSTLLYSGLINIFGCVSPGNGNKTKINKWDYINLKRFCTAKKLSTERKGHLLNGKRYLQTIYPMKG